MVVFPRLSGTHPALVLVTRQFTQDHNRIGELPGESERSLDSGTTWQTSADTSTASRP